MERTKKITCVYPNFCETCSLFVITDQFFATVIDIKDECTEEYENPCYEPFTKIRVNGQFEEKFNQTRCCEGSRTLIYKIDTTTDPTTSSVETTKPSSLLSTTTTENVNSTSVVKENASSNDTRILPSSTPFQSIDMTLLLTAGIIGVIVLFVIILLCVMVVKRKRLESNPRKELRFRYVTAGDVQRQSDLVYTQLEVPLEGTGSGAEYVEPITRTRNENQRDSITCTNETPQYCEVIDFFESDR
ncbi:uncharacterized protein LOC134257638 isoform X8 [Saccostrea cucullata]|uniref:uncharacterized protein LOC134257638 isoform X8 n=1 Tax=Saccostrea cuccullata TaxID=36930 RepID=UPI002ED1B935